MTQEKQHFSVLLSEVLSFLPAEKNVSILDVTAGGGGHLCSMLKSHPNAEAHAWDRDPRAIQRVQERLKLEGFTNQVNLELQEFSKAPANNKKFDFILADLGVSSFQFDPALSGMSLFSEKTPDFRMNPEQGEGFSVWLKARSETELEDILYKFAEEPKAKKLAKDLKQIPPEALLSSLALAQWIKSRLSYKDSRQHPATRIFQAFRMAINHEFEQLQQFLTWAPKTISLKGKIAIISFHSIEDRVVKHAFTELARDGTFKVLTPKPIVPSESELSRNPASRSAKLRVIERVGPCLQDNLVS